MSYSYFNCPLYHQVYSSFLKGYAISQGYPAASARRYQVPPSHVGISSSQGRLPSAPPNFSPSWSKATKLTKTDIPCINKFVYLWLWNSDEYWAWLVYIDDKSFYGYMWYQDHWVSIGKSLQDIKRFYCDNESPNEVPLPGIALPSATSAPPSNLPNFIPEILWGTPIGLYCPDNLIYIWDAYIKEYWMWPVYSDNISLYGYMWSGAWGWVPLGIEFNKIVSYYCYKP